MVLITDSSRPYGDSTWNEASVKDEELKLGESMSVAEEEGT